MGAPNIQQQLYFKKMLNENMDGMFNHPKVQNEETITEGLLNKIELAEGSRGTARLERMKKSLIRNLRQGRKIIGDKGIFAGASHMAKKYDLRRQISDRTRAAAMRERGRAGLHPGLKLRDAKSPSQGINVNLTGGYEYQEDPKRIPKSVMRYRTSSNIKRNRGLR